MADDKKAPVIVIKKIKGGHAGAHGGAWKVAYADFVTAMMCFFLVMWLMGSDEEVKEAVANYFNNPTSAWRLDMAAKENYPLGEQTGAGENVVNGAEGQVPEDVVERPSRPYVVNAQPAVKTGPTDTPDPLEDKAPEMNVELLQFSLPETVLFQPGSSELKPGALAHLQKLQRLLSGYRGTLTIKAYSASYNGEGGANPDGYELSVARVTTLSNAIVERGWIPEESILPEVSDPLPNRGATSDTSNQRMIEFVLAKER